MPLWLLYVLTVLAVYRVTRISTTDDFPPVLWLRDRVAGGWRPLTEPETVRLRDAGLSDPWRSQLDTSGTIAKIYVRRAAWSPYWLAELVTCPWCVSGWLSGAATLWLDLDLDRGIPQPAIFGFAVWAGAALIGSRSWA